MDKKEIRSSNILFLLKCLLFFLHTDRRLPAAAGAVSLQIPAVRENRIHCHHRHLRDCRVFTGFMTGKRMGSRKFLWGLAVGLAYFAVMALISLAVNHEFKDLGTHFLPHCQSVRPAGCWAGCSAETMHFARQRLSAAAVEL